MQAVPDTDGAPSLRPDRSSPNQFHTRTPTLEGAVDCAMTVRDGPAKGVFRLVFDEKEFPAALAGLEE